MCNTDSYYGEHLALNEEKLSFLFSSSCVSIKKYSQLFSLGMNVPAREGHVSELEAGPVLPLPWPFFSAICQGKLSSQNPSELRVF